MNDNDDIPIAIDPDVERIASRLLDYITTACLFEATLKMEICEALYEMRALTRGEEHTPAVQVFIDGERV